MILRSDTAFGDTIDQDNIKRHVVRSGISVSVAQVIKLVLNITGFILLARLLSPTEYGMFAMVMVILNFGMVLKGGGLAKPTIQAPSISSKNTSTLFWINLAIGGFLLLCMLAISPFLPVLYNLNGLTAIGCVLSFSYLLQSLRVQHDALLNRHMCFSALSRIEVLATLFSFIVAITMAWCGYGVWSLVGQILFRDATATLLSFYFCRWIPERPGSFGEIRNMITFGAHVTIFDLVQYFSRNIDDFLVGKYCGVTALGMYDRAYKVITMPISTLRVPFASVALPTLTKIVKDEEQFRAYARKYIFILSFIALPMLIILYLLAEPIILFAFGAHWMGIVPMVKIFALVALIQTPASIKGLVLLASGKSKQYMLQGIGTSIATISAFLIGLQWGPIGVATSYLAVTLLIQIPTFWHTCSHTALTIKTVLSGLYRPLLAGSCAALTFYIMQNVLGVVDQPASLPALLATITAYLMGYGIFFLLIPGGYVLIKQEINSLWLLRR